MDAEILGFFITHTDPSASPAQGFYRFAAGSWLDRAEIPDTESQLNGFTKLYRQVNEQIVTLLPNASVLAAAAPKGSVEQQVGDFYQERKLT